MYENYYTFEVTLGLMRVVNGGRLFKPLDWLALQHEKVYRLLKRLR